MMIIVDLRSSSQADSNMSIYFHQRAESRQPQKIQGKTAIPQRYSRGDLAFPRIQTTSPIQYYNQAVHLSK
ncbi:hypothetical protein LINGRAHAP2_LOCUS21272 [Linum grandiflorum]